jgi:MoxR-like ATPase
MARTTQFHAWLKSEVEKRLDMTCTDIIRELQPLVERDFPGRTISAGSVRGWQTTARKQRERASNAKNLEAQLLDLRSMVNDLSAKQAGGTVINRTDTDTGAADAVIHRSLTVETTDDVDAFVAQRREQKISRYIRRTDGVEKPFAYCIRKRKNVILTGERGSGKSEMAETLILLIDPTLDPVEVTVGRRAEADTLFGRTTLVNDDGVQVTEDQHGPLDVAATQGRPLIINEIGNLPSDVQSELFAAMEGKPFLNPLTGETICPQEGFFIVGTANHLNLGNINEVQYDTGKTSAAFRDRAPLVIHVDYMPKCDEAKMLKSVTGSSNDKLIEDVVEFASLTRTAYKAGELQCLPVSSRMCKEMVEWLDEYGVSSETVHEALRYIVYGKLPDDQHLTIEESARAVWQMS